MAEAQAAAREGRPVANVDAADLVWEQVAEAAIRAYRSGATDAALAHWRRCLDIARARFKRDDPRLATALANLAFARLKSEHGGDARYLFAEAEQVLSRSGRWVTTLTPDATGPSVYDPQTMATFRKLLARTRMTVHRLRVDGEPPSGHLEQWRRERPSAPGDMRKLVASALLIVSRAG